MPTPIRNIDSPSRVEPGGQCRPLIQMEEVSRTYSTLDGSTVRAVDSVTCDIRGGEFVSILGPSGCGKSTLLMMIAGLLPVSSGRISFKGAPITGPLSGFGIVFQDPILFPWRSVSRNVELPGEIIGLPKSERANRARRMLDLVKLSGFEEKYPNELSGGMQQRVAIARALVLNPSLLLMDEPFGALDAITRDQMNLDLQRISLESGATVVFVTHSIPEAAFLSDRVFVMSARPSVFQGIVTIDTPRPRSIDILNTDRFGRHVSYLRNMLDSVEGTQ